MSKETENKEINTESKEIKTSKKTKLIVDGDVIVNGSIKASEDITAMSQNEEMTEVLNKTTIDNTLNEPMYATIAAPKFEGLKFALTRDVKKPNRANTTDAGIDFYIPRFDEYMIQALINANPLIRSDRFVDYINKMQVDGDIKRYFVLQPHERILIPSGVKCEMYDSNRALIAFNKSGVSTKHGLTVGACVVDSGYQGEIHISLINTSPQSVSIYEDMKAVQFLEVPVFISPIQFVEVEDIHKEQSTRGNKGFGAHDKI